MEAHNTKAHGSNHQGYIERLLSMLLSFVVMYLLMYSMADRLSNVYFNLSNVYMTGLMAGSMLPIMLLTMGGMLGITQFNIALWLLSLVILGLSWFLLRSEAGVGDEQFLRAMIPHHSAAVQTCDGSTISDARVKKLCEGIISSQEREITEMKTLLEEPTRR